ncbi:MAG: PD40 domain-containing protein [Verrucomicrobia bacterium]|nr:PD40 domain-containing protein [Verrucomicrobiota bacterium]
MKIRKLLLLSVGTGVAIATPSWANPLVGPLLTPTALSSGAAGDCHNPGVSADGRFVVFVSTADDLVTNDSNGAFDVFVRDRQLGSTLLVSVNSSGTRSGNGASQSPTLSSNGQFVVFESAASDLVPNDTNNASDVFLRDLVAGTTTLISVNTAGVSPGNLESTAPSITPNGRYVLFASRASNLAASDANNAVDLFVRDTVAGTTTLVTRNSANTASSAGRSVIWDGNRQISDDGRWVTFHSSATNVVSGDSNAKIDVFMRDLQTSSNLALSVNTAGTGLGNGDSQNPSMDISGSYVVFQSAASNVATNDTNSGLDVFLRDRVAGTTALVSVNTNGASSTSSSSGSPVLSKDGNVVVFVSTANNLVLGDTNSSGADLFHRDLAAGTTTLIASGVTLLTSAQGARFVPALSADGRFVIYQDVSKNLVLFDAVAATNTTIATNVPGADATMTDDANWIVFVGAPETTGGRNIYLYDRAGGTTELISLREPGLMVATGSAASRVIPGGISSNGQFVVFESYASDLDAGDTNHTGDVWIGDLNASSNGWVRLNTILDGFSRGPSRRPVISDDGRWVAFEAIPDSTPLAGLGTRYNLYAFDRLARTNELIAGVGKVSAPSFPAFSQQGAFMAFQSSENNVGGYATTVGQIYYRDLTQDSNRLVSLNYQGNAAGSAASSNAVISTDGRYVAYLSSAGNLVTNSISGVNAILWDSVTGSNILASADATGAGLNQIGRVAFGANGPLLAFERLTNTFLFDVASQTLTTTLTDAVNAAFSADGRFVACERSNSYSALDTNLTTDVYLIDRTNGLASLISVNREGIGAGNNRSLSPLITPDSRYVLFRSRASNLAANDTNGMSDVFLRDLLLSRTILLSVNRDGTGTGNQFSGNPIMSADGSTVLLESYASDLITGDYNESRDIMMLRLNRSDTDGDGLPDDWELAYFNGLQRDGTGDYDGDGQTDLMEFMAGTDPTNAGSILRVVTLSSPSSGPVQIFWSAVPGKKYRVQFKTSLSDSMWNDLVGDVTATDTTGFKEDSSAGAWSQRFYRVMLVE